MLFHFFSHSLRSIPVLAPTKPVTPQLIDQAISARLVDAAFLAPTLIDGLAKVPAFRDNLRQLKYLVYSSAALADETGEVVRQRTRLLNLYGQTEMGLYNQLYVDDEDHAYVRFGRLSGVELRPFLDDLYEVVMV